MATTVFITGASGLVGLAVGRTFRREGYVVYGLVRSEEKAKALLREEIIPVIGDLKNEETWKEYVVKSGIVVDTVLDSSGGAPDLAPNKRLVAVAQEASRASLRRKTVIYTSGLGVFGDRPGQLVDENTPLPPGSNWRSDFDDWFIQQEEINPVVIRPAAVYGMSLGMWGFLFDIQGDVFEIRGRRNRRLPWIHVNDLAQLYYLAAKHIDRASHQIFHGTTLDAPTWEEVRLAVAKYLGWTGTIAYTEPVTPFEKFTNIHLEATPKKAQEVLGWSPKYPPFLHSLDVTYKAYLAHKGERENA
jgi:nucleoside-diphosphate-sugar epimerase